MFVAAHNAQLRELYWECFNKDSSPARLVAAITQCPLVRALIFFRPEVETVVSACECLSTRLQVLRLQGSWVGGGSPSRPTVVARATKRLFTSIALHNANLLVLDMPNWSMIFTGKGLCRETTELMLRSCPTLLDLDLSGNCDLASFETVAEGCRHLRRLGIGGASCHAADLNGNQADLTRRFNEAMANLGAANPTLLCLDASDTCMSVGGLSGLSCTGLVHLSLARCDISDAALEVIASGMPALQFCNLSKCNIWNHEQFTDVGIKAMLTLPRLRHLDIEGCKCVSEEMKRLCPSTESMAYSHAVVDLRRSILRDYEGSPPTDVSVTGLDEKGSVGPPMPCPPFSNDLVHVMH